MAEQLALEQVLGDRRAVDGDERPLPRGDTLVQRPRHQLLARAALAEQQHGRVAGGGALQRTQRLLERRVLAEHARQPELRW